MSDKPLVSVIVLFDRGEFEPCLSSLLAQEGVEFEIVAVVSDEEDAAKIQSSDRIRVLTIKKRNPAFRRNSAATRANGKYLAFIDDDATAPPDWLKKGVEYLENNSVYTGIGGPNLCPVDTGFRELITEMVLTAPLIGAGSRAYRGGGAMAPARPGEVHLVNFIVRRDGFDRVNGLNEEMGYGGEDTEFLYMVTKLGGNIIFDPNLFVYHRRRPFGLSYFRQRFWLRRQSARLSIAYPGVYIKNLGFIIAVFSLPVAIVSFQLCPFLKSVSGILFVVLSYIVLMVIFSFKVWRRHPVLVTVAPVSFLFHHAVYIAGLWWGLLEALFTGPWRVRRKIRRSVDSCSI